MDKKLIITKKQLKGEDGYKVFSIRIKEETVKKLDAISKKTNRSRNDLINLFIDYAIENCEIKQLLWYLKSIFQRMSENKRVFLKLVLQHNYI